MKYNRQTDLKLSKLVEIYKHDPNDFNNILNLVELLIAIQSFDKAQRIVDQFTDDQLLDPRAIKLQSLNYNKQHFTLSFNVIQVLLKHLNLQSEDYIGNSKATISEADSINIASSRLIRILLTRVFVAGKYSEILKIENIEALAFSKSNHLTTIIAYCYAYVGDKVMALNLADYLLTDCSESSINYYNAGNVAKELGEINLAICYYEKAAKLNADDALIQTNLAYCYKICYDIEKASEAFFNAYTLDKQNWITAFNLAQFYQEQSDFTQSEKFYRQALKLNQNPIILNNLGNIYIEAGDEINAEKFLKMAIEHSDAPMHVHRNYSLVHSYSGHEDQIFQLQNIDHTSLNLEDAAHYHFTMYKMHEDQRAYSDAFQHLKCGNQHRKEFLQYNVGDDIKLFSILKSINYTRTMTKCDDYPIPIFIVGLPRSGSTFLEQLLAQHSQITALGELPFLEQAIWQSQALSCKSINKSMTEKIMTEYFQKLRTHKIKTKYFIDKMPLNFRYIGFIRSVFKDYRIIYINRDFLDTAWSIYRTYFNSTGNGFSHDLEDIVQFNKLYINIMDHWNSLGDDDIINVSYANLKRNKKEQINLILSKLNLANIDWAMVTENRGLIKTASSLQIRQDTRNFSKRKWLPYKQLLAQYIDSYNDI